MQQCAVLAGVDLNACRARDSRPKFKLDCLAQSEWKDFRQMCYSSRCAQRLHEGEACIDDVHFRFVAVVVMSSR